MADQAHTAARRLLETVLPAFRIRQGFAKPASYADVYRKAIRANIRSTMSSPQLTEGSSARRRSTVDIVLTPILSLLLPFVAVGIIYCTPTFNLAQPCTSGDRNPAAQPGIIGEVGIVLAWSLPSPGSSWRAAGALRW
jgi:hypothetical protein